VPQFLARIVREKACPERSRRVGFLLERICNFRCHPDESASSRRDLTTAGGYDAACEIPYALQTASINLRNTEFEVDDVTDVVIDRDTVPATCINGQQWFEEDFADENEQEAEEGTEEETEGETAKEITVEEARKQVQGVVRNWLLEKVAQKQQ
jgi:hypothetical protein